MPINFDNTYINLPSEFYSKSHPDTPPSPQLVIFNEQLAQKLNLKFNNKNEITNIFSGKTLPKGSAPIAMAYSGHQFGHFSPQLGDGRALLLGEILTKNNIRHDIHLKGSGPTQYSRRGDGKATIGPAIREYLLSEAMHRLGAPTTRALAITTTGEQIQREQLLPGAVITRTSESFIRVGTFEYFARHGEINNLKKLLNYCINRSFPELTKSDDIPLDFFKTVMRLQINLTAKWMSYGFIHGVMNTDNTSISGLTIDYGPCAFMDYFEFNKVYSSIDKNGRYSFSNQPPITLWNLTRLAECLITLYDKSKQTEAINRFEDTLNSFEDHFSEVWLRVFSPKLGLSNHSKVNEGLIQSWLQYIESKKLDFTNSFIDLSLSIEQPIEKFKSCDQFMDFYQKWQKVIIKEQAVKLMNAVNPIYIPRNHLVESVILSANQGDYQPFYQFNQILSQPYKKQDVDIKYTLPPTDKQVVKATFCGT